MKVIYTDAHLGHNPQQEIAESGSHSPHEHTARAENIRETLQADATMELLPPTQWGVDPINAVHNPGLNNFLTTAWNDYQREVRPSREVVPDFFYRPSLRDEMSQLAEPTAANARLGWWCFETTTPITEGS
jgi:acetoin utilization deacetylase AcuC-like enzyme